MFEPKRVFWEVEVEGAVDQTREEQISVEEAVDEYIEQAKMVKKSVAKVKNFFSKLTLIFLILFDEKSEELK